MGICRKLLVSVVTIVMISSSVFIPLGEEATVEAASSYNSLRSKINTVMADSRMKSATTALTVRKASTGEIVYQYYGDKGITPASSLKLLTAAAALETLGEDYRFPTAVYTDGQVQNGLLNGNLYMLGKGDPTLLKSDLDNFANSLVKQGIKRISGNIVGDDSWFDSVRLSAGILAEDEPYYYAAPISALTISPNTDFDTGSVIVQARPGTNGKATRVTLTPQTNVLQVVNKSRTVPKGYKNTLKITRQVGTNKVIISGNSPIGSYGTKEWISVIDPTLYALDVFKKSLLAKGITFVPSSAVMKGKTPKNAKILESKRSKPLKDILIPFMKLSNNTHAEMLAKEMGKVKYGEGSWTAGLRVMREYVDSIGLDSSKWKFEDASGMSYSNKLTTRELSLLLYAVQSEPWYKTYSKSLPVAGMSDRFIGGTLRNRLKTTGARGNITAKTGSLENIKALAGYAKTKSGETLIFTVLTEKNKSSTIPALDRIASTIANH